VQGAQEQAQAPALVFVAQAPALVFVAPESALEALALRGAVCYHLAASRRYMLFRTCLEGTTFLKMNGSKSISLKNASSSTSVDSKSTSSFSVCVSLTPSNEMMYSGEYGLYATSFIVVLLVLVFLSIFLYSRKRAYQLTRIYI
jgi:hypothetical protein